VSAKASSVIVEREIGSRRVCAECSPEHARRAGSALDVFARLAAAGEPPRPGSQIRFGWSLLRLAAEGEALRVTEPDFVAWPAERWASTIDVTLAVLAAQTSLLRRLDVDGEDCFFDQVVVAAPGALARPEVFLHRVGSRSAADSGWLLGAVEDPEALASGSDLGGLPIASLVGIRRALLQTLSLPSGFIVTFSGDSIVQVFDAAGRERLPSGRRAPHSSSASRSPTSRSSSTTS
jgi:hypothetical protein